MGGSLQGATLTYVHPGQVIVAEKPMALQAVLGPAVVVCLWDTKRRIGALAHYASPSPGDGKRPTTRYGAIAIPVLIRKMEDSGSKRSDLVAKLFGGAYRSPWLRARRSLGHRNARLAIDTLRKEKAPVVAEDLGGRQGCRLIFLTNSNRVKLMRTAKIREADWMVEQRD